MSQIGWALADAKILQQIADALNRIANALEASAKRQAGE